MKAKYYIFFVLLLGSFYGIAQKNYWTISGIVVEDKKTPIQFASVFINNTSIGASTSEKGNFQLNVPVNFSQVELIISVVGFKTLKRKINYSSEVQIFKFQLEKSDLPNEEVASAIDDKDWQEKWKTFETALLGDSKFAKDCKILNADVVKLDYGKAKKLIGTAKEPLLIKNAALGYKILLQLDKFETDGINTTLSGLKYFEKIDTANVSLNTRWEKNQRYVFNESFRSFLVALSLDKLAENDYAVFKIADAKLWDNKQTSVANEVKAGTLIPMDTTKLCAYDKDAESFVLESEYPLLVFMKKRYQDTPFFTDFPYKYAQIVLPKGYVAFSENGLLNRSSNVVLKEHWTFQGLANILPEDFDIEGLIKETSDAAQIDKLDAEAPKKLSRLKQNP